MGCCGLEGCVVVEDRTRSATGTCGARASLLNWSHVGSVLAQAYMTACEHMSAICRRVMCTYASSKGLFVSAQPRTLLFVWGTRNPPARKSESSDWIDATNTNHVDSEGNTHQ